jgi:hypothetical protein
MPVPLAALLQRFTPPTLSRTGAAQAALCSYGATLWLPLSHLLTSNTPSVLYGVPGSHSHRRRRLSVGYGWTACTNARGISLPHPTLECLSAMTLETVPRRKRKDGTSRSCPALGKPTMHDQVSIARLFTITVIRRLFLVRLPFPFC